MVLKTGFSLVALNSFVSKVTWYKTSSNTNEFLIALNKKFLPFNEIWTDSDDKWINREYFLDKCISSWNEFIFNTGQVSSKHQIQITTPKVQRNTTGVGNGKWRFVKYTKENSCVSFFHIFRWSKYRFVIGLLWVWILLDFDDCRNPPPPTHQHPSHDLVHTI